MTEPGAEDKPVGIFGGIKKFLSRHSEARSEDAEDDQPIRTSEIRSPDGLMATGDSMRKMDILESAREKGKLINDGDAPQYKK